MNHALQNVDLLLMPGDIARPLDIPMIGDLFRIRIGRELQTRVGDRGPMLGDLLAQRAHALAQLGRRQLPLLPQPAMMGQARGLGARGLTLTKGQGLELASGGRIAGGDPRLPSPWRRS
jgi:hypothetical protein